MDITGVSFSDVTLSADGVSQSGLYHLLHGLRPSSRGNKHYRSKTFPYRNSPCSEPKNKVKAYSGGSNRLITLIELVQFVRKYGYVATIADHRSPGHSLQHNLLPVSPDIRQTHNLLSQFE